MHIHYYTFLALNKWIQRELVGKKLLYCFSQSKNELVLEWEDVFLRISCQSPMLYVVPVRNFARAKRNVVDLFHRLHNRKLRGVRVVEWDRILILEFDKGFELILKMHGASSNVLLYRGGEEKEIFRKDLKKDPDWKPVAGVFRAENMEGIHATVKDCLNAISPILNKPFEKRVTFWMLKNGMPFSDALLRVLAETQDGNYYITKTEQKIVFSLFPPQEDLPFRLAQGIRQGLATHLSDNFQYAAYLSRWKEVKREIEKPLKRFSKLVISYKNNIQKLKTDRNPEELGHLLMANLHNIKTGDKEAEVEDFYMGGKIKIKLKEKLSPQANAARYYKNHKTRKLKIHHLVKQFKATEAKLQQVQNHWDEFWELPLPKDLEYSPEDGFEGRQVRIYRKTLEALAKGEKKRVEKKYPFRHFQKMSYEIFVGMNAKNNDVLSFKFATKDDLWLHAKDVAGSHVIVRQKAGQTIPLPVLEFAAGLAAWYSKRRTGSMVPVIHTPRKFIRKRKGDPPGAVVVSREKVIFAEPISG